MRVGQVCVRGVPQPGHGHGRAGAAPAGAAHGLQPGSGAAFGLHGPREGQQVGAAWVLACLQGTQSGSAWGLHWTLLEPASGRSAFVCVCVRVCEFARLRTTSACVRA